MTTVTTERGFALDCIPSPPLDIGDRYAEGIGHSSFVNSDLRVHEMRPPRHNLMISRKIDDRVFFLTRQIVSTSSTERVASAVNRVIPIPVADHIRLRPTDTTSAGRSTHGA